MNAAERASLGSSAKRAVRRKRMSERCERTNKRRNECPSSLDASVPESFYSPQDSAAVFAACARCNHVDVERNVNNQPTTRKFMAFPLFLPHDLFFFLNVFLFFFDYFSSQVLFFSSEDRRNLLVFFTTYNDDKEDDDNDTSFPGSF